MPDRAAALSAKRRLPGRADRRPARRPGDRDRPQPDAADRPRRRCRWRRSAAGKHVYSEKPLATTLAGTLTAILADGRGGGRARGRRRPGHVPRWRACRRRVRSSMPARSARPLGRQRRPSRTSARSAGIPTRRSSTAAGGGPLLDRRAVLRRGPGRAARSDRRGVRGRARRRRRAADRARAPGRARPYVSPVPTTVIATLRVRVRGDRRVRRPRSTSCQRAVRRTSRSTGRTGSLSLGDPNTFDGTVAFRPCRRRWLGATSHCAFDGTIGRGIGLADMIEAIREDRPHRRASGAFAFHVPRGAPGDSSGRVDRCGLGATRRAAGRHARTPPPAPGRLVGEPTELAEQEVDVVLGREVVHDAGA